MNQTILVFKVGGDIWTVKHNKIVSYLSLSNDE
jgi:hypothetical protein